MSKPEVKPYEESSSKKQQVETMFDNIAHGYDSLNRFLSLGIDVIWRKKTISRLESHDLMVLDVATGTADMALTAIKNHETRKIIGLDVSAEMLKYGEEKITKAGLSDRIHLVKGDSEDLPFETDKFDAVMVAFGVRNFENLEKGLSEIQRVLKPDGKLLILEFTKPRIFGFKQLFQFYFRYILPKIGRLKSKDPKAYKYLFESVQAFPDFENFTAILQKLGYQKCQYKPLTLGVCSIYEARKA